MDKPRKDSVLREYVKSFGCALVLALVLRATVVQSFEISSGSMENTLLAGDFLLANKFIYGAQVPLTDIRLPALREPRPDDIIIFTCPDDQVHDPYIKRCVAIPGQTVEIHDKVLYIDGIRQDLPAGGKHIDPRTIPAAWDQRDNFGPVTVPDDMYFCLGDNRDDSRDSRYWGFLPKKMVKGKALAIYWSWDTSLATPMYDLVHKIRWKRIGRTL